MYKVVLLDDIYLSESQRLRLASICNPRIFAGIPKDDNEILSRIGDAEIVVLGWTKIGRPIFEKATKLNMIAVWATGFDYVDVSAATDHHVAVANVPGYASIPVAELVFAMILALARNITLADRHVREGNYNWKEFQGFELRGKTLGIIGVGSIGTEVANIGNGFGMKVLGYTAHPSSEKARRLNIRFVEFDELLSESDIVTIHAPLNNQTKMLITEKQLGRMKNTGVVINTARAEIIDQRALINALEGGKIGGAGLDVINPDESDLKQLCNLDNVLLTPHMAFNTVEAIERKTDICLANIEAFVAGAPKNIVNPQILRWQMSGGKGSR